MSTSVRFRDVFVDGSVCWLRRRVFWLDVSSSLHRCAVAVQSHSEAVSQVQCVGGAWALTLGFGCSAEQPCLWLF